MYAIIETGGKQYRVAPGDIVSFEHLNGDVGQVITFDKILLVGGHTDAPVLVGTPYVASAALQGEIVEQSKGDKLLTIKYKRRKGYRRTIGHRQQLTRILVTKIDDGKGHSLPLDTTKRLEVLRQASVPFSTRQEQHQAKHLEGKKSAGSARSKAAPKAAAKTTRKTAKKA